MDLLRGHPALAARLFDIKQDCLWQYIILGEAKPFGTVTDYWRRVEVAPSLFFELYHFIFIYFFFVLNVFHICVMYLYFIFFYSCSIRLAELLTFTV